MRSNTLLSLIEWTIGRQYNSMFSHKLVHTNKHDQQWVIYVRIERTPFDHLQAPFL